MPKRNEFFIVVKINKLEIQIVKFVKNYSTGFYVILTQQKNKYYN